MAYCPVTGDWRHILNTIQDMVMVLDLRQQVLWANRSFLTFLGLPEEDVIGRPCHRLLHAGTGPGDEYPCARMGKSGQRESFDMDLPDRDMRVRITVDPLRDGDGNLAGAIHILSDVTATRRAELRAQFESRRLTLLARIGTSLLGDFDIKEVLAETARDLGRFLGVPRCVIFLSGSSGGTVEYHEPDSPSAIDFFRELSNAAESREAFDSGRSLVITDIRLWPYPDGKEGPETILPRAFIGVPLCDQEKLFGVLFLDRPEPHEWTENEIETAEAVARQVALAVRQTGALREQQQLAGRLLSLMNNVPGVVYRGLRDWSLTFVGAEVERLTGYTPEEFLQGSARWREIVHPDDLASVKMAFRNAVREQRKVLRVEYRIRHRDGGYRWLADRRQLIYGPDGSFDYVDGLLLDISESRRVEKALRASNQALNTLIEASPLAIMALDREGIVTLWNPASEKMFGWTKEEAIGRLNPIVPEEKIAEFRGLREQALREGGFSGMKLTRQKKGGIPIDISLSTAPMRDAGGNITGIMSVMEDITERKKADDALKESEEKFRNIVSVSPIGISIYDSSGQCVLANDSIAGMVGATLEQILEQNYNTIESWKRTGLLENAQKAIREQQPIHHQIVTVTTFGRDVVLDCHHVPFGSGGLLFMVQDISERKKAEEDLRQSEYILNKSQQVAIIGSYSFDIQKETWTSSATLDEIFGIDDSYLKDLPGWLARVVPEQKEEMIAYLNNHVIKGRNRFEKEYKILRYRDGETRSVFNIGELQFDESGNPTMLIGTILDITERKRIEEALRQSEEQLLQAQKMEAVGRLAGGVAHDFNNLLTAIRGYSDLLLHRLDACSPYRKDVEEIHKAGERASALTQQLLAFSRKQVLQPKVLDLNEVVAGMEEMAGRMIGENVDLITVLRPDLWSVKVDKGQIEQVVMNLVVNARDAIDGRGKITIETGNVYLDDDYVSLHSVVAPGAYVMLAVSDTGSGMDDETTARLFEPFFTTKEKGKGTGLGLSTVYGIVKQSDGYIWVYSEPNQGSVFKIYFPRHESPSAGEDPERLPAVAPRGHETILLVEDEVLVRVLVRDVLTGHGYTVLEAKDGAEAMGIAVSHRSPIHLMIADVVMPNMGGPEVAVSLAPLLRDMRVLFMSGYTDEAIAQRGILRPGTCFLQKPFRLDALLRKVREVLDA
ncbi:MAG: PAS domain S-box protein [Deltaproteobacteria bacterium]|nr:PAS domain S-box protein [Deltaproteobacteria bacterium]MDH3382812.1 PAS domain S-box protein [Deltaproteobacteria bacterium]